jgi:hypothetical protein
MMFGKRYQNLLRRVEDLEDGQRVCRTKTDGKIRIDGHSYSFSKTASLKEAVEGIVAYLGVDPVFASKRAASVDFVKKDEE